MALSDVLAPHKPKTCIEHARKLDPTLFLGREVFIQQRFQLYIYILPA